MKKGIGFHTTLGKENPIDFKYHENLGIERHLTNRAIRSLELFGEDDSISDSDFEGDSLASI